MKIFIFSDIHGKVDNILPVLEQDIFDEYLFAGDLFGYFMGGRDVIELVSKYNVKFILGNHDLYFLRQIFPEWFRLKFAEVEKKMITADEYNSRYGYLYSSLLEIKCYDLSFFENIGLSKRISIDNLNILMCHGSPQNPFNGYIYPDYEYFDELFDNTAFDILILGHSHKDFIKIKENRFIINPGSCTLPRSEASPSYAVFDSNERSASIHYLNQNLNFTKQTKSKLVLKTNS